jgi:hypothetical protein
VYHSVDISEIQRVVGKYATDSNLVTAAAPMAVAGAAKMFLGKNKLVNVAVVGGGVWFAVQEFSTPLLKLMTEQFGYLQSIFASFRG